ncbi:MAG: Eco57I restriction-modification methylase [bacterium ADurb.Bin478]|nr:MAG: Eco57I restriction-modification methylase [bacterium ADurb.Bin478]
MSKEILQDIISDFSPDKFTRFFREKNRSFSPRQEELSHYNDLDFKGGVKLGEIKYSPTELLIVCAFEAKKSLSERSGKKAQYDKGKKILKEVQADAGVFIFYDKKGDFRLSLIYANYLGKRRDWSLFRRFTYFVSKDYANKTFLIQLGSGEFSSLDSVKEAFSLAKVTNEFYEEFNKSFGELCSAVAGEKRNQSKERDFALLYAIRLIFLGFIQKRKWLGDDERFLQNFLAAYFKKDKGKDKFYTRWLKPLFFEALNTPPGHKVAYGANDFPSEIEKALQMAPFLNGGLFEEHELDDEGYYLPDAAVSKFFDFLFSYNFTIEENTLYDEELELNPEFLGIIFERLVNKEDGAVYTPRTEVDFMCRMALVKWLEKNQTTKIPLKDLYEIFFLEGGPDASEDQQRRGDFTAEQKKELIDLLSSVTVCDPAVGSGAFLVGMLHVLDEVEYNLRSRVRDPDYKLDTFQRKERIIARSLYGVEVKQWAVWITQLRLWITLFIDAPEEMRSSLNPILPSLDFKVRQGDSLVQRIGKKMFPVTGHANIPSSVKAKITKLKELKNDYYQNKAHDPKLVRQAEFSVFRDILDAEIDSKRQELKTLGEKPKQMDFLGESEKESQNKELFQERIERLKEEIEELHDEKDRLRTPEERPLVWNIEFSEIFFEKAGFDIIIGNPPYVRQEDIADPMGKIKDAKDYKNALADMVAIDFPREFKKEKINAQSDLYTYFYIRSLRLLNEKGIHVFICSNSWLDVGYGVWLQKFLLNHAPLHFIFDNHSKRSFAAADVNTIISVIGAPVKKVTDAHMIKFVAFKRPFEEVVFTENLLEIERTRTVEANEKFRVYPMTNEDLFRSGFEIDADEPRTVKTGKYIGEKWGGKFLRAPDVFLKILEHGKDKLIRLGDIADVRRGFTTGANEFFCLDHEAEKKWKIEREFLKPFIKSPRELKKIGVGSGDPVCKLFFCDKERKLLRGTFALKFIEWGERSEKDANGNELRCFHKRPTCGGRTDWWVLGERKQPSLYCNYLVNEIMRFYFGSCYVSDNFQEIHARGGVDDNILFLLANSTLFWFFVNMLGRANFGGGLLKIQTYEVASLPILKPDLLEAKISKKEAMELAKDLSACSLESLQSELGIDITIPLDGQKLKIGQVRKRLDDLVFNAIGLSVSDQQAVYWSVCELVKNRLDKARSV